MSGDRWAYRAFLALYGFALLVLVLQMARPGKAVQSVETTLPPIVVTTEDPFPCLTDPIARRVCADRGCVNRCEVAK